MYWSISFGLGVMGMVEEVCNGSVLKSYAMEFISTFVLIFIAVGAVISAGKNTGSDVAVALAYGFAVFVAGFASGKVSGGHVNPAVTLGLVIGRRVNIAVGVFYCAAQLLGSAAACLLLSLLNGGEALPVPGLGQNVGVVAGMAIEMVTTFAVGLAASAGRDPLTGMVEGGGAAAVGVAVGAGALATGSLTGGVMNPVRGFGPAVVSGEFRNQGVYWVGPLVGGALGVLVYKCLAGARPAGADAV